MQMANVVTNSVLTPLTEEPLALEYLGEKTVLQMPSSFTYENVAVLPEQSSSSPSHSSSVLFAQAGSAVAIILALTALVRALAALIQAAQD